MKKISVTVFRNQLSHYLRLVKKGESILILERSLPVARLEAVATPKGMSDGHLERWMRDGIVTRAGLVKPPGFLKKPPLKSQRDPVKTLIEERGGR